MCHCQISSDEPKLITKAVHITSYEDQTVILPCQVLNLPAHMHIIWQHSKREKNDHTRQVVLTIGKTLIESNYRVRVLSNGTTGHSIKSKISKLLEPQDMDKITTNNLEIRKLRIEDSGWYECQLPTKPTQKSYVFLQVHGVPRIQTNQQLYSPGDLVELTCHVHRLPKNSTQLYWTLNGKRVVAATVIDNYAFNNTFRRRRHRMVHQKHQKRSSDSHTTILNNYSLNVTRLRISAADQSNTGVYRCHYDKIETEYLLDFDRDGWYLFFSIL